jgi:hypothetical protein
MSKQSSSQDFNRMYRDPQPSYAECHSYRNPADEIVALGGQRKQGMGIVERHGRYAFTVRCRCATPLKLEYDVQSVDDTLEFTLVNRCDEWRCKTYRNVTKDGQQDVDEEISVAAALEEDTQRRKDDGKEDFADIAGGERHDGGVGDCSM